LASLAAASASLPQSTTRCHSIRLSEVPASFFQLLLLASEKVVTAVPLERAELPDRSR
jgi:hypothetical protein